MGLKQATSDKTSDKNKRLIYAEDLFAPVDLAVMCIGGRASGKTLAMYEQLFRQRVEMAPTVDAVPVVRCGECTHWAYTGDGRGDCTHRRFHLDGQVDPTMAHDEYCALGERRPQSG